MDRPIKVAVIGTECGATMKSIVAGSYALSQGLTGYGGHQSPSVVFDRKPHQLLKPYLGWPGIGLDGSSPVSKLLFGQDIREKIEPPAATALSDESVVDPGSMPPGLDDPIQAEIAAKVFLRRPYVADKTELSLGSAEPRPAETSMRPLDATAVFSVLEASTAGDAVDAWHERKQDLVDPVRARLRASSGAGDAAARAKGRGIVSDGTTPADDPDMAPASHVRALAAIAGADAILILLPGTVLAANTLVDEVERIVNWASDVRGGGLPGSASEAGRQRLVIALTESERRFLTCRGARDMGHISPLWFNDESEDYRIEAAECAGTREAEDREDVIDYVMLPILRRDQPQLGGFIGRLDDMGYEVWVQAVGLYGFLKDFGAVNVEPETCEPLLWEEAQIQMIRLAEQRRRRRRLSAEEVVDLVCAKIDRYWAPYCLGDPLVTATLGVPGDLTFSSAELRSLTGFGTDPSLGQVA